MNSRLPARHTMLAAGLFVATLAGSTHAQDLYKSRTEMLRAEAANKQANASIIDAMANYGKAQAEVAKIRQEIREKSVQNELLEAKTYYEKRAAYEAYRAAQRAKSKSAAERAEMARRTTMARQTSYQLGGAPGKVRWPTLLKTAAYAALRSRIDGLLKSRTHEDSGAGSQNCVDTLSCVDRLKSELRENIRRYKPSDYLAARKFLDTVAAEAQEPVFTVETLDKIAGN